ncbi:MAG: alpha/beta hydrolase-fold protein [Planctomycetota bacterium]
MRNRVILVTTLTIWLSSDARAQEPITIGEKHVIRSEILDEDRTLWIYEPPIHARAGQSCPVLYLLDGDIHFHHTTGIVQFLAERDLIPEMIVVGIANTDRTRDLTPTPGDIGGQTRGGGADRFLEFLTNELHPWVDEHYQARPLRILVGHSFGGLFAVHALRKVPNFFHGIIAISPSLQWTDQHEASQFETWLDTQPEVQGSLYITAANEGELLAGTYRLAGVLQKKAPTGLSWKFIHMPAENHGTIPHRTTYDGLEFLFADWRLKDALTLFEAGGWSAVEGRLQKQRARFGYESERSFNVVLGLLVQLFESGRYEEMITLLGDIDLTAYQFPSFLLNDLGSRLEKKSQPEHAKSLYGLALEYDPKNEVALERLKALRGQDSPEKR